eukprot:TRINITY_DN29277_c0_g1_i1.p1 TRINITY_DN29277_c0_g1~~TRINITY_DN29277_c0_g1_i1.p1  ORF type:complete len:624 (+),score=87.79 TRINITY_DN29277_c0_g1_i1:152-1873(+)
MCVPTWIGKTDGDGVAVVGSCDGMEYYALMGATNNRTISNSSLNSKMGSILETGTMNDAKDSAFIGGIGVVERVCPSTGNVYWTKNGLPSNISQICTGGENQLMYRQSLVVQNTTLQTNRLVAVGYCGGDDKTLLLESVDAINGGGVTYLGVDVSYWTWTGQIRHRAAVTIIENFAYLAVQSESAAHGWLVKLDWSGGINTVPLWNVSLIWPRTPGDTQTIPHTLHLRPLQVTEDDVTKTFLVVLANAVVMTIDEQNPYAGSYQTDLPAGVDDAWSLSIVPASCSQSPFNVIVAHNSKTENPLQRVFVTYLLVSFSGVADVTYQTEIETDIDMVLRGMAVDGFDEDCDSGLGVWVTAYKTCSGDNPCSSEDETSVVVAFNASYINESTCAACQPGWAGPDCSTKCTCVHGGGAMGACYDGPYHNGSCRCNTRTFHPNCLPCTCRDGICDTGATGTGMCISCTNDTTYGVNCDHTCDCKSGEACDSGIHGSGRCYSPNSSSSSWKPLYTYLLIGASIFLIVTIVLVYFSFCARTLQYVPVKSGDEDKASQSDDAEEPSPTGANVNSVQRADEAA